MWALSFGGGGAKARWAMPRSLGPEIFKKGLLLNIYRYLRAGSEQRY